VLLEEGEGKKENNSIKCTVYSWKREGKEENNVKDQNN